MSQTAISADALEVGQRICRDSMFWRIDRITELPKSRRLMLSRGMGLSWESDVRRTTLVYVEDGANPNRSG